MIMTMTMTLIVTVEKSNMSRTCDTRTQRGQQAASKVGKYQYGSSVAWKFQSISVKHQI